MNGIVSCQAMDYKIIQTGRKINRIRINSAFDDCRFKDVNDSDRESLCLSLPVTCGSHNDLYCLRLFMIEGFIIFEFEFTIHHFKTVVAHCVERCAIKTGHIHIPDDGSCRILDNLESVIRDSKGKGLFCSQPATIDGSYGNIYFRFCFIIKAFRILKFKLPPLHHFKTFVIHSRDMYITHIWIGHIYRPDDGPCCILPDCVTI